MSKTLIVNLFGVPGAGKSTGAAYIFSCIKMAGVNAELITEYAKDKVWERNDEAFRNQAYKTINPRVLSRTSANKRNMHDSFICTHYL